MHLLLPCETENDFFFIGIHIGGGESTEIWKEGKMQNKTLSKSEGVGGDDGKQEN